ncbi:hypothetical protein C6503_09960 [Candidatus Poribacteria bacterium]|nr:MAG: hypothetical protein C6503_09960 [Candidatus Poribacteria bacterium]
MTANLGIAQLVLSALLVSVTFIWGIFRYRRGDYYRRDRHSKLQAYFLWSLSGLIGISTFYPLAWLYIEHLWHESLGYTDVFWGFHKIRWGFFALCFIVAAGFMNINAAIANMLCPESREFRRWTHTRTFSFHRTVICITIVLGLLMATPMLLLDDIALRFLHQPDSAVAAVAGEPDVAAPDGETGTAAVPAEEGLHFGKDRNFYLFSYPMHKWMSLWVQILLWVTCIVVGLLYNFYYRRDAHTMARVKRHIIFHGTALWLLLLLVSGWGSYVNLWGKVYTSPLTKQLTTVHGLFYMDAHLEGATKIYCGVLIGIAIVIVFNIFWRRRLLWYVTAGVWGLGYVLLIHAYPIGVHVLRLRVDPYPKEAAYLQRHIEETRRAFELDKIQLKKQETGLATLEMIKDNAEVKKNIQLWDRRVLHEVLREKQIKRHYNFHPYTDVDRYTVDGEYRQVLIAAREVNPGKKITDWYPLKTRYIYGFGVCVAPVNEFVEDGYPNFWVKDAPVTSVYDELNVARPEIYYGEMTYDYAIVKTLPSQLAPDLEPDADTNADVDAADTTGTEIPEWQKHTYEGDGGIPVGGWFRRLCFALRLDFYPILLSNRVTPESRLMFRRRIGTRRNNRLIKDRVSHIAPFLNYDPDPYIVINDGELYWIVDFYVTSRYYPNSQIYDDDTAQLTTSEQYDEPDFDKFNYIRNSGVAVVNAYTGAVNFYAVKENEEVMQTYQRAFPNLFKSVSEMPEGLRSHLRYPDYLTRIQATLYGDYHQEAELFYNSIDTWSIPKETYYSTHPDQEMMPYYAMIRLPGEDTIEFVNIVPFTPPEKEKQLKAWMVTRCDAPNYGESIVYTLDTDVAGPTLVEEDIDKEIGQKQVGWEKTSNVIRGNLLIIPVEDALFYVEAIYLQAKKPEAKKGEKAEIDENQPRRPKLEMVIVKAGTSELGTAKTFDEALDVIFLGVPVNGVNGEANGEKPLTMAELFKQYEQIETASETQKKQIWEQIMKLLETQGNR